MEIYARFGVPEYWIAVPATRTVEMYRLEGSEYMLALAASGSQQVSSPTLPGLHFVPDTLFP